MACVSLFSNLHIYLKARNYANTSASHLHKYMKDHPGANPSHFCTLKQFAEFVGLSSQGILEERPTVDSIRSYIQCFTSG